MRWSICEESSILRILTWIIFSLACFFFEVCTGSPFIPIQVYSDTTITQNVVCNISQTQPCILLFNPTTSFIGFVDVFVKYSSETVFESAMSTLKQPVLMCFMSSSQCDFISASAASRGLSLESSFVQNTPVNISITATIGGTALEEVQLIVRIKTSSISCLDFQCASLGTCSTFMNTKQCNCQDNFGARGCNVNVTDLQPGQGPNTLAIPAGVNLFAQFSFLQSSKDMFAGKQIYLVFNGGGGGQQETLVRVGNNQCIATVTLTESQIDDGYAFAFKEISLNLNDIYGSTYGQSKKYFAVLIQFDNRNSLTAVTSQIEIMLMEKNESSSLSIVVLIMIWVLSIAGVILLSIGVRYCVRRYRRRRPDDDHQLQPAGVRQVELISSLVNEDVEMAERRVKQFVELLNRMVPVKIMSIEVFNALRGKPSSQLQSKALVDSQLQHGGVCSICLCEIEIKTSYRVTLCSHYFHDSCISEWMLKQRNCPMCRASHDIADLQVKSPTRGRASAAITKETYTIQGKPVQFEMFINQQLDSNKSSQPSCGSSSRREELNLGSLSLSRGSSVTITLAQPEKRGDNSGGYNGMQLGNVFENFSNDMHSSIVLEDRIKHQSKQQMSDRESPMREQKSSNDSSQNWLRQKRSTNYTETTPYAQSEFARSGGGGATGLTSNFFLAIKPMRSPKKNNESFASIFLSRNSFRAAGAGGEPAISVIAPPAANEQQRQSQTDYKRGFNR